MTVSLADRLRSEPQAASKLSKAILVLLMAGEQLRDEATHYDYLCALEAFVDEISGDLTAGMPSLKDEERPHADDSRPVYQRIDDEDKRIGNSIRGGMSALQLIAALIVDDSTRSDYIAALETLWDLMGLPTKAQRAANPAAYANVSADVFSEARERLDEIEALEHIYKAS